MTNFYVCMLYAVLYCLVGEVWLKKLKQMEGVGERLTRLEGDSLHLEGVSFHSHICDSVMTVLMKPPDSVTNLHITSHACPDVYTFRQLTSKYTTITWRRNSSLDAVEITANYIDGKEGFSKLHACIISASVIYP